MGGGNGSLVVRFLLLAFIVYFWGWFFIYGAGGDWVGSVKCLLGSF